MIGGSGRAGGSGGRMAIYYETNDFIGELTSVGGSGNIKEYGAAGTVYLKKESDSPEDVRRRLQVYGVKGATGVSPTA